MGLLPGRREETRQFVTPSLEIQLTGTDVDCEIGARRQPIGLLGRAADCLGIGPEACRVGNGLRVGGAGRSAVGFLGVEFSVAVAASLAAVTNSSSCNSNWSISLRPRSEEAPNLSCLVE